MSAAILRREAEELRELVSALARELAIAQPRIALMGGLLAEENVYREAVCAALSGMAQPVRPLHDALWGAAQLAFEALGNEMLTRRGAASLYIPKGTSFASQMELFS